MGAHRFVAQQALCAGLGYFKRRNCGLADPFDFGQAGRFGGNHICEAAELPDQPLGDGLHIRARLGKEEKQFEQLVVRQRLAPRFEEAGAQALAVAGIVRFVLRRHCGRIPQAKGGLVWPAGERVKIS
jgi:hypothetical protein